MDLIKEASGQSILWQKYNGKSVENEKYIQQRLLEQLDISLEKINFLLYFTPYKDMKSKWIIQINIKCRNVHLFEEHIGKTLSDTESCKEFLVTTSRVWSINEE